MKQMKGQGRTMIKKSLLMLVGALLTLGVVFAAPANAGNNTSNFYLTGWCRPWNMESGRLDVTNYDAPYGTQVYHADMDAGWTTSGYQATTYRLYIDGRALSNTNDVKITVGDRGRHTI